MEKCVGVRVDEERGVGKCVGVWGEVSGGGQRCGGCGEVLGEVRESVLGCAGRREKRCGRCGGGMGKCVGVGGRCGKVCWGVREDGERSVGVWISVG